MYIFTKTSMFVNLHLFENIKVRTYTSNIINVLTLIFSNICKLTNIDVLIFKLTAVHSLYASDTMSH